MLPTYDQVVSLPKGTDLVIPQAYVDLNGHMNVRHYLGVFDDCGWPYLQRFGIDAESVARTHRGVMDLENHIRYVSEVLEGEQVSVHLRLIERGSKVLHWMNFMVNHTTRSLAATLEMITVYVDLEKRRAVAWSPEAGTAMDAQLANDQALDWAPPTSGCMGLRR